MSLRRVCLQLIIAIPYSGKFSNGANFRVFHMKLRDMTKIGQFQHLQHQYLTDTIAIMGKQRASKYKLWLCAGISSLCTVF